MKIKIDHDVMREFEDDYLIERLLGIATISIGMNIVACVVIIGLIFWR